MQMLSDVEVAITRSSTDVDVNFLNHAKKLKALVRAGVGVDNVDIPECSKEGDCDECPNCKYYCRS